MEDGLLWKVVLLVSEYFDTVLLALGFTSAAVVRGMFGELLLLLWLQP